MTMEVITGILTIIFVICVGVSLYLVKCQLNGQLNGGNVNYSMKKIITGILIITFVTFTGISIYLCTKCQLHEGIVNYSIIMEEIITGILLITFVICTGISIYLCTK